MNRFQIAIKAAIQLGLKKTALFAFYQLGLRSGFLKLLTPTNTTTPKSEWLEPADAFQLTNPGKDRLAQLLGESLSAVVDEANTIVSGHFHQFSAQETVPIDLIPPPPLTHWTQINDNPATGEDIKFTWEAARFGWVFPLGRAYILTKEDKYAAAFWQQAEIFLAANPPNIGPNWASGQEVALRILAFTFALQVFNNAESTTLQRRQSLLGAIAEHARRIPPTILYARAQNNNHLVTEAVGLYTAGCLLPNHPQAARWRKLGWRWFNWACLHQIEPDGTYVQHSMNYHRLLLQAALWMDAQTRKGNQTLPEPVRDRLAAATSWLYTNYDKNSGRVPNLGHNDGAHILPLAAGKFGDYRPTIQAASCTFLGGPVLSPGPWDETTLWIGLNPYVRSLPRYTPSPGVLRLDNPESDSWASLRAVHYKDRFAQADQLHVELWWQGLNIACDAGTYRYTAPPPWNNALARTGVHNTVMVDNQEQMLRAGRFLWLDWAQAKVITRDAHTITAQHDGYKRLDGIHQRSLINGNIGEWQIVDTFLPARGTSVDAQYEYVLHWLLPDLPWHFEDGILICETPHGHFSLQICILTNEKSVPLPLQIIRAGEVVYGPTADLPTYGWISPTYASKNAGLSIRAVFQAPIPTRISSVWRLDL